MFESPKGSVLPEDVFDPDGVPYIIYSPPGTTFGGVEHYDESCTGTLSIQIQGDKKWRLWAPFDLGDVKAPLKSPSIPDNFSQ